MADALTVEFQTPEMVKPAIASIQVAGGKLVAAYGEAALDQEVRGTRRAVSMLFIEIETRLLTEADPQQIRERSEAMVGEDKVPTEVLFDLLREYGQDEGEVFDASSIEADPMQAQRHGRG